MRNIFLIAWNDLRLLLRERSILINMFLVSLVMVGVVGLANSAAMSEGSDPAIYIDIIDHDDSDLSQQFIEGLRESNAAFVLCPLDNTESDRCGLEDAPLDETLATDRLIEQQSLALIIIPAGFEAAIQSGQGAEIIYRSNENATAPGYILQSVQAVTQRLSGSLSAQQVAAEVAASADQEAAAADALIADVGDRASTLWAENPISVSYQLSDVEEGSESSALQRGMGQSVPGMGSMYVMFAIFPALAALIRDKETWTLQRLLVTPATRAQVLAGKMLARFVLGMIQYATAFGMGALIGINFGHDLLALLLLMAGFSAAITALTLAIATLVRTEGQAGGIATFLTLTLAPLGGAWWPIQIVPPFMQTIGYLTPVAWVMRGFQSLIYEQGTLLTVWQPIAVLFGMAAIFYTIGSLRFKTY